MHKFIILAWVFYWGQLIGPISAQQTDLFVHGIDTSGVHILMVLHYPDEELEVIDTLNVYDMMIYETGNAIPKLLATSDSTIVIYDIRSLQAEEEIPIRSRQITTWGNVLISIADEPPFFSLYNIEQDFEILFASDTSQLQNKPVDVAVFDDYAYILNHNFFTVFDLHTYEFVEGQPFSFPYGGENGPGGTYYLISKDSAIYFSIEYYTGAERWSLMQAIVMDDSVEVSVLRHVEFMGNPFPPVYYKNKLFVQKYPDHFDLDSMELYIDLESTVQYSIYGFASDNFDSGMFVYDPVNHEINQIIDNEQVSSVRIPMTFHYPPLRVLGFHPGLINSTFSSSGSDLDFGLRPNPAGNEVFLSFPKPLKERAKLEMHDLGGKLLQSWIGIHLGSSSSDFTIDLAGIPSGYYILTLYSEGQKLSRQLIIQ